jgi:hypothetical protein
MDPMIGTLISNAPPDHADDDEPIRTVIYVLLVVVLVLIVIYIIAGLLSGISGVHLPALR